MEGVEWGTTLALFQGLSNQRAFVYRLLLRGQTDADVGLQNYGGEIRYRHRVLRKWLFLEYLTSLTWPKEFEFESREANWGFGIGLEMYFGPRLNNRVF